MPWPDPILALAKWHAQPKKKAARLVVGSGVGRNGNIESTNAVDAPWASALDDFLAAGFFAAAFFVAGFLAVVLRASALLVAGFFAAATAFFFVAAAFFFAVSLSLFFDR